MGRKSKSRLAQWLLIASMLPGVTLAATPQNQELTQRVDRLEKIIKGQGLISLLARVDQLQNEVQRLNGENEELNHRLDKSQKSQRKMYDDLDQRLQQTVDHTPAPQPSTESVVNAGETAIKKAPAADTTEVKAAAADATNVKNDADATVPASVENGEAAYQAALQILRSGQYDQALTALAAFPQQYPQSTYLPNVYYWQGEANYVLRKYDQAISSFQTVLDKYPLSTKVADALLKRGFSEYEKGDIATAKTTLNTVMQQYPDTSASRLAKVRLDRIKEKSR